MNRRELFRFLYGLGLGVVAAETYERLYNIPALERAFRKEIEYWLSQYLDAKRKTEELSSRLKKSEEEIGALKEYVSYWKNKYNSMQDEVNKLNTKVGELSSKLNEANEKIDSLDKELYDWKSKYESTKEEANRLKSIIGSMDELERESVDAISYYREKMNEAIDNLKRTIEKYRAILGDDRVAFESSTVKILEDLKLTQEKLQKVLPYFPLILNFALKPTKVFKDKIYDINVSFEVASPLNSLREVEVMLIPEEYRYFITKYGMREEDYDKVFPREEIRSVKIRPRNLEREMFSVDFGDLKGGKEYIVKARVKDVAGSEKVVEMKTHYIRQFENLGKELYDKGIIVGASYMSGYYPWQTGKNADDYPLLGKYDASDEIVQWKHVDWTGYAGINVFFIDAGAWEDWKINGKEGNIMKGLMDKGMKCAFLYDHWGDYFKRGTNPNAPEWAIDLTYSTNKKNFVGQLSTILNSKLIDHPNYFRVSGRPVVFLYDAAAYINEKEAFTELRNSINKDVLFLGDTLLKIPALPQDSDWYFKLKDFSNYDWISTWVGFVNANVARSYSTNYDEWYYKMTDEWSKWVEKIGKTYVSSVIPGFKYIWESIGIQRRLDRIQNHLLYSLDKTKLIRIDTWNDFSENTFVEPSQNDGFNYINKIHEIMVEKFSKKMKYNHYL
jgi:archaellum component FlaC